MIDGSRDNIELAHWHLSTGRWRADTEAGLVYGTRGRPFSRLDVRGYVSIHFQWDKVEYAVRGHRLIWEVAHGPLSPDLQINHLNGRKDDNRIVNLEAVTGQENIAHAIANGLFCSVRGVLNPRTSLTEDDVLDIYRRAWAGEPAAVIARDYPTIGRTSVGNIKHGWCWAEVTGHEARATA